MVAFGTAFGLNFITLLFERESAKFQLALLACYINFLAGFSDYMSWKGYAPIVRDSWGQGFQLLRTVMWLLTTPAMVYLLSIISDFSRLKVRERGSSCRRGGARGQGKRHAMHGVR